MEHPPQLLAVKTQQIWAVLAFQQRDTDRLSRKYGIQRGQNLRRRPKFLGRRRRGTGRRIPVIAATRWREPGMAQYMSPLVPFCGFAAHLPACWAILYAPTPPQEGYKT